MNFIKNFFVLLLVSVLLVNQFVFAVSDPLKNDIKQIIKKEFPHIKLDHNCPGKEALDVLDHEEINKLAEYFGIAEQEFCEILNNDSTIWLDEEGRVFVKESFVEDHVHGTSVADGQDISLVDLNIPLEDTFKLHSAPGSSKVIYLDFDGHLIPENSAWVTYSGNEGAIDAPAFSRDKDFDNFSNQELTEIQKIWQIVAEDYAALDVDVTTEDPGYERINRANSSDQEFGTRVLISPISSYFGKYGGIAYIGVFDNIGTRTDRFKPALVFPERLSRNTKYIAEAASHEAGHNLGIYHDGGGGDGEYYRGHSNWAPIMGVGYKKQVTHWSKGEYNGASDTRDDFVTMARNGLNERVDDHLNDFDNASDLNIISENIDDKGVISSDTDLDFFQFSTTGGNINLLVETVGLYPNLDVELNLYDENRVLLETINPNSSMGARLNMNLASGLYYISIDGVGKGSPNTGYSDYSSLGFYEISGFIPNEPVVNPIKANNDDFTLEANSSIKMDILSNDEFDNFNDISIEVLNPPINGAILENDDKTISYTPNTDYAGLDSFSYMIQDSFGQQSQAIVSLTINAVDSVSHLDFDNYNIDSYGGKGQDRYSEIEFLDSGNTLKLSGNTWKKIDYSYNVTASTVLEFDFKADILGEIHGIGFDNNLKIDPTKTFALAGSQTWGLQEYRTYNSSGSSMHFKIPVGEFYTGNFLHLFFVNDDDKKDSQSNSYFSNIRIYDDNSVKPYDAIDDSVTTKENTEVTFDVLANDSNEAELALSITGYTEAENGVVSLNLVDKSFTYKPNEGFYGIDSFVYSVENTLGESDSATVTITVEQEIDLSDNVIKLTDYELSSFGGSSQDKNPQIEYLNSGTALKITGNGWKRLKYPVNITSNTVIEFDFSSTNKGEIHGLGLSTNSKLNKKETFKVFGTQNWGLTAYDNYDLNDGVKHYKIPLGQYLQGNFAYLIFANDHDVSNPTANSTFSNLVIYEE